jgi:hypothetical protein
MAEVITLQHNEVSYCYSDFLPDVVRIIDADYDIDERGLVANIAHIYGNAFQAHLTWTSMSADEQLQKGTLARVYWPKHLTEIDGAIPIVRLVPISFADHSVNLFETIPKNWLKNSGLIERAKELWTQLPENFRALFNELFWDGDEFRRYVTVPASINDHHNGWGGNLRHVVEVAEHAERIALDVPGISTELLILAALIHNTPIANGYCWMENQWVPAGKYDQRDNRQRFKARITSTLERHPELLKDCERHALWSILFASTEVVETPKQPVASVEKEILSMATRLSCVLNLRNQGGVQ